ncbi:hypothetical protein B0H11DRAFT_2260910 [Mycena galericulata]|nr:hypothetical protein B0H11DRAFT_2260910 [Mycena galericulata]
MQKENVDSIDSSPDEYTLGETENPECARGMGSDKMPPSESCTSGDDDDDKMPPLGPSDDDDDEMPPLEPYTLGEIAEAITRASYARSLAAYYMPSRAHISQGPRADLQTGEHFEYRESTIPRDVVYSYDVACAYSYNVACQWDRNVGRTDGEGIENAWAADAPGVSVANAAAREDQVLDVSALRAKL